MVEPLAPQYAELLGELAPAFSLLLSRPARFFILRHIGAASHFGYRQGRCGFHWAGTGCPSPPPGGAKTRYPMWTCQSSPGVSF